MRTHHNDAREVHLIGAHQIVKIGFCITGQDLSL